jgi:hypothetical protein
MNYKIINKHIFYNIKYDLKGRERLHITQGHFYAMERLRDLIKRNFILYRKP